MIVGKEGTIPPPTNRTPIATTAYAMLATTPSVVRRWPIRIRNAHTPLSQNTRAAATVMAIIASLMSLAQPFEQVDHWQHDRNRERAHHHAGRRDDHERRQDRPQDRRPRFDLPAVEGRDLPQ